MKRMIDFADKNNLEIVPAYYPPYYSKYNAIERCWGILENHWSADPVKYDRNYLGVGKNHDLKRN
ncbi:MAG: hypothetical protein LUQ26_11340 [Methylococcaceae bacterium]|nr:hypothetical protein [Methylococcaceae bacterium]